MAMAMCRPCAIVTSLALKGYRGRGLPVSTCSFRNLPNHAFVTAAWPPVRWENRRGSLLPVRAIHVSGPGSIDSPLISSMRDKIKEQLNAEEVVVQDAYGDGRHVSIDVVSESFEGQSAVNRQRMVYKAIWEELQNAVHAVDQLKTRTPAEAAKEKPRL